MPALVEPKAGILYLGGQLFLSLLGCKRTARLRAVSNGAFHAVSAAQFSHVANHFLLRIEHNLHIIAFHCASHLGFA